jgi:hypothetical protein
MAHSKAKKIVGAGALTVGVAASAGSALAGHSPGHGHPQHDAIWTTGCDFLGQHEDRISASVFIQRAMSLSANFGACAQVSNRLQYLDWGNGNTSWTSWHYGITESWAPIGTGQGTTVQLSRHDATGHSFHDLK